MRNHFLLWCFAIVFSFTFSPLQGQYRLSDNAGEVSPLTREYVYPKRIVWSQGNISQLEDLLKKKEIVRKGAGKGRRVIQK